LEHQRKREPKAHKRKKSGDRRSGPLLAHLPGRGESMRILETLLEIVELKRAEGLKLVVGEVPALLGAGGLAPLTMPALSTEMMEHVLADSFTPDERETLRQTGRMEAVYRSSDHGSFAVHAQSSGDKLALTLRRGAQARDKPTIARRSPTPLTPLREPEVISGGELPRSEPGHGSDSVVRSSVLDAVLDEAVGRGASDVIVSAARRPLLRIDGTLVECQGAAPIADHALEAYVLEQLGEERHQGLERTGSADFSLEWGDREGGRVRLRANAFRHDGGMAIALRPIVPTAPSLLDLHLPTHLTQLLEQRTGLLLFTGPTGSGKSTTLAALLEHVNRTRAAHIITLEDPVEYVYQARRSIIHQREVGRHVDGFASGLRAALRENPDILLVGEMRDPETIRLALTAAQTGHLVLSTLHSGSTVMAIDRIIDVFPESEKGHVRLELAASLRHIVAQQLVQATTGGRLPALEILTMTHAIAAQIRDGRTHMVATQLETGAGEGMVPMARSLASLVRSGQVSRGVALAACDQREVMERLLDERAELRPRSPR
jgi:twitching motility protein PilT